MESVPNNNNNNQHQQEKGSNNANRMNDQTLLEHARSQWLQATSTKELQTIEQIYRSLFFRNNNNNCNDNSHDNFDKNKNVSQPLVKKQRRNNEPQDDNNHPNDETAAALGCCQDEDDGGNDPQELRIRMEAGEKLALLLFQNGRSIHEANDILRQLNYKCRLADFLFSHDGEKDLRRRMMMTMKQNSDRHRGPDNPPLVVDPPCRVYDNFLSPSELQLLQSVFLDPNASYWTDHDYQVEPHPSPYVSYVIPIVRRSKQQQQQHLNQKDENDNGDATHENTVNPEFGFLGCLIHRILQQLSTGTTTTTDRNHHYHQNTPDRPPPWKPQLAQQCTHVELWAHNRPTCTGHQLHFDSDNEGQGTTVRHPLVSTVLYLSSSSAAAATASDHHDNNDSNENDNEAGDDGADAGAGPTLITNQRRVSRSLADRGWICFPRLGRLVAFDGRVLHGVIPGRILPSPPTESSSTTTVTTTPTTTTTTISSPSSRPNPPTQPCRRVTLMLAFWRRLEIRQYPDTCKTGAAKPFPTHMEWAKILRQQPPKPSCVPASLSFSSNPPRQTKEQDDPAPNNASTTTTTDPNHSSSSSSLEGIIPLSHVYEAIPTTKDDSKSPNPPWNRSMGMPLYEEIYQGF